MATLAETLKRNFCHAAKGNRDSACTISSIPNILRPDQDGLSILSGHSALGCFVAVCCLNGICLLRLDCWNLSPGYVRIQLCGGVRVCGCVCV